MWSRYQDVLVYRPLSVLGEKIAAFDLDWTITRPVDSMYSNRATRHEWLPYREAVFRDLSQQGYQVVIFTNQKAVGKEQQEKVFSRLIGFLEQWKQRLLPEPWIFAALGEDSFRKPSIGMWLLFEALNGNEQPIQGFFCGDATGPDSWSDVDRVFGETVQRHLLLSRSIFQFLSPEQVFPSVFVIKEGAVPYWSTYFPDGLPTTSAIIVFVGAPGTGKSTFYHRYLQGMGWEHVNRDIQKTEPRMMKLAVSTLANKGKVVIDNTNPDLATRSKWIQLGRRYGVPVWCLYFVRDGVTQNRHRPESQKVPDIAYRTYFKRLVEPKGYKTGNGEVSVGSEETFVPFGSVGSEETFDRLVEVW